MSKLTLTISLGLTPFLSWRQKPCFSQNSFQAEGWIFKRLYCELFLICSCKDSRDLLSVTSTLEELWGTQCLFQRCLSLKGCVQLERAAVHKSPCYNTFVNLQGATRLCVVFVTTDLTRLSPWKFTIFVHQLIVPMTTRIIMLEAK